jgi:hypothetical protein
MQYTDLLAPLLLQFETPLENEEEENILHLKKKKKHLCLKMIKNRRSENS